MQYVSPVYGLGITVLSLSYHPKRARFGHPFPSLLTDKSSKDRFSVLAGFFSALLFLGALPPVTDVQVISCLLQNVTTAPTECICCRRMGLEPSSSMLCACAFILQVEKLHCLPWLCYKAEFIHSHKTLSGLHTERCYKGEPIVVLVKNLRSF